MEECPICEAHNPHAGQHPQALLYAATSKQDCSSHQDIANRLSPDDRLAAPIVHMVASTDGRHLQTATPDRLVDVGVGGSTLRAGLQQLVEARLKHYEFPFRCVRWNFLFRPKI